MPDKAKLFITGRSQAVRLPLEYRFEGTGVFIRREAKTGDVVLSRRPNSWDGLFQLDSSTAVPTDFLNDSDRNLGKKGALGRDPFAEKSAVTTKRKTRAITATASKTSTLIVAGEKTLRKNKRA